MAHQPLILEIGVGGKKQKNQSLGLDIRRTAAVDIIGDARYLPLKNSSIDILYSSHTLEHFSHRETVSVIREWPRVLKPEGSIEIRCPDLRMRALFFFINPDDGNIHNIYGGQEYPENYHKSGFSYTLLKKLLEQSGIIGIRRIFDGYKWIPGIPVDLHIIGKKEKDYEGKNMPGRTI